MAIEERDNENLWRCPMLGGPVPFKHCRTTNDGLPCTKIPGCWGRRFDAGKFLSDNYSEEELKAAFSPQPDRLGRILGMIGKSKEDEESPKD